MSPSRPASESPRSARAPRSVFADFELTSTGRFGRMQEQYRLLVDEQLICGLQIHVGVADRELAVQIAQRVERDLPVLLALSASSPYWNGSDTGYASIRSLIWQRWPSAGADRAARLRRRLRRAALRPDRHRRHRRLEDGLLRRPTVLPRTDARAAGLRRLPHRRRRDPDRRAYSARRCGRPSSTSRRAGRTCRCPRPSIGRPCGRRPAAACRGKLLDASDHPRPMAAADAVHATLDRLRPQLEELGDWDEVCRARRGRARPRLVCRPAARDLRERGELDDVVEHVVRETHGPASGPPPAIPALTPLCRPRRRRGGRSGRPAAPRLPGPRGVLASARPQRHRGEAARRATAGSTSTASTFTVRGRGSALSRST